MAVAVAVLQTDRAFFARMSHGTGGVRVQAGGLSSDVELKDIEKEWLYCILVQIRYIQFDEDTLKMFIPGAQTERAQICSSAKTPLRTLDSHLRGFC